MKAWLQSCIDRMREMSWVEVLEWWDDVRYRAFCRVTGLQPGQRMTKAQMVGHLILFPSRIKWLLVPSMYEAESDCILVDNLRLPRRDLAYALGRVTPPGYWFRVIEIKNGVPIIEQGYDADTIISTRPPPYPKRHEPSEIMERIIREEMERIGGAFPPRRTTCGTCAHWRRRDGSTEGTCENHDKIGALLPQSDAMYAETDDPYVSATIETGENFGCINHTERQS